MDACGEVTGVLSSWYHSFWLGIHEWDVASAPLEAGMIHRLPEANGVAINTATHAGYFRVTLRAHAQEPTIPSAEWEDVARGSLDLPTAQVFALPICADGADIELVLPRAGVYGFQVAGKGRVESDSLDAANPPESYLIDVWPIESLVEPTSIRITSEYGLKRIEWENTPSDASDDVADDGSSADADDATPPRNRAVPMEVWRVIDASLEASACAEHEGGNRAEEGQALRVRRLGWFAAVSQTGHLAPFRWPADRESLFLTVATADEELVTAALQREREARAAAIVEQDLPLAARSARAVALGDLDRALEFWTCAVDFQVSEEDPRAVWEG